MILAFKKKGLFLSLPFCFLYVLVGLDLTTQSSKKSKYSIKFEFSRKSLVDLVKFSRRKIHRKFN